MIIQDLKSMLFALLQILPLSILLSVFVFERNSDIFEFLIYASYILFAVIGLVLYFVLRKFTKAKLTYISLSFLINLIVILVGYKLLSTSVIRMEGLILIFDLYAFAIYNALILLDLSISLIFIIVRRSKDSANEDAFRS